MLYVYMKELIRTKIISTSACLGERKTQLLQSWQSKSADNALQNHICTWGYNLKLKRESVHYLGY